MKAVPPKGCMTELNMFPNIDTGRVGLEGPVPPPLFQKCTISQKLF